MAQAMTPEDRARERKARANFLINEADTFRIMNIGRTERERDTGSLRYVGELEAAIMAYRAIERE